MCLIGIAEPPFISYFLHKCMSKHPILFTPVHISNSLMLGLLQQFLADARKQLNIAQENYDAALIDSQEIYDIVQKILSKTTNLRSDVSSGVLMMMIQQANFSVVLTMSRFPAFEQQQPLKKDSPKLWGVKAFVVL